MCHGLSSQVQQFSPWVIILTWLCISFLSVPVSNILANFSILVTYENFVVLGLVAAIPASAGRYYNSQSAFILISVILDRDGYSPVW